MLTLILGVILLVFMVPLFIVAVYQYFFMNIENASIGIGFGAFGTVISLLSIRDFIKND